MKARLEKTYRSKNTGKQVFMYVVTGSAKELDAYKEAQGENFREDENGRPLWFTTNCAPDNTDLIITSTGKVIADMSQYDQAASLARQYGGNFGQELARAAAQNLLGFHSPAANNAPASPASARDNAVASAPEISEDLNEL